MVFLSMLFTSCVRNEGKVGIPKKYNVLFISIDDLRPELGSYGNKIVKTPHLDYLGKNGLVFDKAYCQQAVCSPSRISVLTGLRPDVTKITDNKTHHRKTLPHVVTLPQYFKAHGYYSVGIGKVFHGHDHTFDDTLAWSTKWLDAPEMTSKNIRGYLSEENLNILKHRNSKSSKTIFAANITEAEAVPDNAYPDGKLSDLAIESLKKLKDTTFFLAVGFRKPHEPFVAPKKYWDLYDPDSLPRSMVNSRPEGIPSLAFTNWEGYRNYSDMPEEGPVDPETEKRMLHGYYACISYIDAQIGKLMNQLKVLGLDEKTIVVVWGDHGLKLGEYGDWSKKTNFEVDTRSPLILYHPQIRPKNTHVPHVVELLDIYPTVCNLANIPLPREVQGKSLMPYFSDTLAALPKIALSQYPRTLVFETGDTTEVMGYSIRTRDYRYTKWLSQENKVVAEELYSHKNMDGLETENLADNPQLGTLKTALSLRIDSVRTAKLKPIKKW